MDYLSNKELNELKADSKAFEIEMESVKKEFKEKLTEKYGPEIDNYFKETQNPKKVEEIAKTVEKEEKSQTFFEKIKNLFSFS